MRNIIIIFFLLLSLLENAQGFRTRYYSYGALNNTAKNIYEIAPGQYIAGGIIYDSINGQHSNRLCIAGVNSQGQMQWIKKYGNYKFEYLDNILITRWFYKKGNNLYYSAGARDSNNKYVGVLIKFNFNGDTLWQKIFRDSIEDVIPQRINSSVDGGFLITGFFQNWSNNTNPCLIIKTDANGNELWRRKIHKPIPDVQDGKAIIQDSASKKIVIAGFQNIGDANNWQKYDNILVLDSLGNLEERRHFSGGGEIKDMIQTRDKKFIGVGMIYYSQMNLNTSLYKSFAVKFNATDLTLPIWELNGFDQKSPTNYFTCVNELANGNIILGGVLDTLLVHNIIQNCLTRLTTINSSGMLLKNYYYNYKANSHNTFNEQRVLCVNSTSDNGLISAIECLNSSPNPFFIVKYDSTGCDSSLAYCAAVAAGIQTTELNGHKISIYPNPGHDQVNIELESKSSEDLQICFIDITGREIKRVELEQAKNTIDIKNLQPGVYLLKVENKDRESLYQCKFLKTD